MFDYLSAGTDLLTTAYSNHQARAEAQRNRRFQENMSSSAYQRAMSDMRLAGLNPILAGKFGAASTPQGAMASLHRYNNPVATGYQSGKLQSDIDLVNAQEALADVNAKLKETLMPGAEGIEVFTTQARNLVQAIDGVIGSTREDYQNLFDKLSSTLSEWMLKASEIGRDSKDVLINVYNDLGDSIQQKTKSAIDAIVDFPDTLRQYGK